MKTIRNWVAALLLTEFVFVVRIVWSVSQRGILPPPLYYDANDSFMDFFNTNFWALYDGRYEIWRSIYPIFSFFVGKLLTSGECAVGVSGPFELRDCAVLNIGYIVLGYVVGALVCTVIAARNFGKHVSIRRGRFSAVTFSVILLSLPGLFALERGNYILLAFLFLSLGVFFRNDWRSALCLAAAISLKQYLLVLLLAPLLKRRFDFIALTLVFVVALNTLAYIYIDEMHFYLIFDNMIGFSSAVDISFFEKMWYSTSFSAWSKVLENSRHVEEYFSLSIVAWMKTIITIFRFSGIVASMIAVWWAIRASATISWEYISFLMISVLILVSDSLGGYALVLVWPYLVVVVADEIGQRSDVRFPVVLPLAFLLLTPLDFVVGPHIMFVGQSFLSGSSVAYLTGVTLLAYIRPLAVLFLVFAHIVYLYRVQNESRLFGLERKVSLCR